MKKNPSKKDEIIKSKSTKRSTSSKNKKNIFFVVGIGASAGGLEALKVFFDKTPSDSGMAFIIVQHLDPLHKSLLPELIARHTKVQVLDVINNTKVNPNTVYIIPPNKDLRILHGHLHLIKPTEPRGHRLPVNGFFHSLAKDQKEKAIGIILSGTGADGTLGLKEIKAEGGMTIVQDPKTALFDGMPKNAILSKTADYILSPEKMTEELMKFIKIRKFNKISSPEMDSDLENQLKKILLIIRKQTGYDFSQYKTNTIVRRIIKREALLQLQNLDEYIHFLLKNPAEVESLYKEFLIGVTSFFRDTEVYAVLEKKTIPYLLEKCQEQQELRVWVCGCSTGEEAYSLAILFKEALEKKKQYIKVLIFASDIDKDAIAIARNAIYPESILANVSPDRLSRFFVRKDSLIFQVKKEIREMVIFAHQNVIKDPPFSKMDLISCRNLLIYMDSNLQKKIIPLFHYSLNKGGILLLGTSENIGEYSDLFSVFDSKSKIFKKNSENPTRKSKAEYEFPYFQHNDKAVDFRQSFSPIKKINVSALTEKILIENYAPPSVIIDKNNDALYFSGNTGQYLEPPSGEPHFNILEMAKIGLKHKLDEAIKKTRNTKNEVRLNGIEVKVNNHFQTINLIVKPVLSKEVDLGALMIIFETPEIAKKNQQNPTISDAKKLNPKISEIEKELKITREHLQTAINELETSNDNLQTSNEEFQSSFEELQSTNEELETSREELQSLNEELITVNSELQGKIEQLSQANDDLNNLLSSIEVATVFLDRDMKIKRFTPTATKIFNLIPSDIDRPVTHLSTNIIYKGLAEDVKNALKTLAVKTAEVQATDGTWYHMRILPYRTAANVIEGVLVTFVDISDQKSVEEKLKKTNEHLNLIMENLPAIPFTCVVKPKIKMTFIGKSSEKVTGFLPEQFISKPSFWINRIHPNDKKKIIASLSLVIKKGSLELPFSWKCANGKYKNFINFLRYAKTENGRPAYIVGVWQEIQDVKNK